MSIFLQFASNWLWILKVVVTILLFVSIFMMWKICHVDFTKRLGAPLGKPYKRTKENEELAKKLSHKSDMWGFIIIICVVIMCVNFISTTTKSLIGFITSFF